MDTATWVQTLDEADCISHNSNILGKGINVIIVPQQGRLDSLALARQPVEKKEKKILNWNLLNSA